MSHRITITLSDKDYDDLLKASQEFHTTKTNLLRSTFQYWVMQQNPIALEYANSIIKMIYEGYTKENHTFQGLNHLIKTHE